MVAVDILPCDVVMICYEVCSLRMMVCILVSSSEHEVLSSVHTTCSAGSSNSMCSGVMIAGTT